ncbi:MAG: hypothetical protein AAF959_28730 [Cyanobacteria bacterium P01_D01_bin.56]
MSKKSLLIQALLPLGLCLTMTACEAPSSDSGSIDSDTSQTPAESAPTEDPSEVDNPDTIPTEIDDPDAVPEDGITGIVLALSGEGVLIVDQQSGNSQNIPFDTDLATAETAISTSLGTPTDTAQNDECGAGPMTFVTWSNGFTINVIEDKFVGWTVRPNTESANLTTLDGIGLGSTLTEMEENYDVGVIESSLGTEFNASNLLFGLLDANESDGIVTDLWSGVACNFR